MTIHPHCDEHIALLERLRIGKEEFAELKHDIKEIKAAVTGNITSGKPGIEARLCAVEAVVNNVNKAAWAIGIPVLLAATFGLWQMLKTIYLKVS